MPTLDQNSLPYRLHGGAGPSAAFSLGDEKRRATSLMNASGAPETRSGIVSAIRDEERFDRAGPRLVGEVLQDVGLNELLDAGVADANPHLPVIHSQHRIDRAEPVVAGLAAPASATAVVFEFLSTQKIHLNRIDIKVEDAEHGTIVAIVRDRGRSKVGGQA
jgi:hypothetical protein